MKMLQAVRCVRLIVLTALLSTATVVGSMSNEPPSIVHQRLYSQQEITYERRQVVELPCVATGQPAPLYSWRKNGQPLNVYRLGIRQLPGVGTLHIEDKYFDDFELEGVYQCLASNELGVAFSIGTVVRQAFLDPFRPTVAVNRVSVGSPLTLRCDPPASYPPEQVYWAVSISEAKLVPVEFTDRVSLDYEGNMYFSHVEVADDKGDNHYICIVQNGKLRSLVMGDNQKIVVTRDDVLPEARPASYHAPQLMWSTAQRDTALRGRTKKLKCIFSGLPSPRVRWQRLDRPLDVSGRVESSSYNQELIISDVQYDDAGLYECSATNTESGEPSANTTIQLTVESAPYWKDGQPAEDVNAADGESALFTCEADGIPAPTITWYINGIPISELPAIPRRTVSGQSVRYESVSSSDSQVLQCNASNVHGYIFANAYLNVIAEPPVFIETPQALLRVAVGGAAVFTCQVFGAPTPVITWKKEVDREAHLVEQVILGGRFALQGTANLGITDVRQEDAGRYFCHASNKFGEDEASGELIVRVPVRRMLGDSDRADKAVKYLDDVIWRRILH